MSEKEPKRFQSPDQGEEIGRAQDKRDQPEQRDPDESDILVKYNNFMWDLPGGQTRQESPPDAAITMDDYFKSLGESDNTDAYETSLSQHTEKRRKQTRQELWDEIDATIEELGHDKETVESLCREYFELEPSSDSSLSDDQRIERRRELRQELYAATEGVFEKLLEKGYNRVDLARGE